MNTDEHQHWYALHGRENNASEHQGDIRLVMSMTVNISLTFESETWFDDDKRFSIEI
jgi:hypothetical protein